MLFFSSSLANNVIEFTVVKMIIDLIVINLVLYFLQHDVK